MLVRQFRLPIYLNGQDDGFLIEAPAGLLDLDRPADAIRREAEEETGYRIEAVTPVLDLAMSPASVNDRLHCFVARIDLGDRVAAGGGDAAEGEDIEVLALPFDEAFAMIATGRIIDAKTILLLYHARLHGMLD